MKRAVIATFLLLFVSSEFSQAEDHPAPNRLFFPVAPHVWLTGATSWPVTFVSPLMMPTLRRDGPAGIVRVGPERISIEYANSGNLVLDVTPSEALIYLDGRLIGSGLDFTAEEIQLAAGTHELRIDCHDYVPFQAELLVRPDRTLHLRIQLQAETGEDPAKDSGASAR